MHCNDRAITYYRDMTMLWAPLTYIFAGKLINFRLINVSDNPTSIVGWYRNMGANAKHGRLTFSFVNESKY